MRDFMSNKLDAERQISHVLSFVGPQILYRHESIHTLMYTHIYTYAYIYE